MTMKLWQVAPTLTATLLFIVQPVLAHASSTEQVAEFPNAVESHLVKYHGRLFSINENMDGSISVELASEKGQTWETMDSEDAQIKDLVAGTSQVDKFAPFQTDVFMATENTDGVSQVWSICKECEEGVWEKTGDAGFGDVTNTNVLGFFQTQGSLYALVSGTNGNALYATTDGETWSLVGEVGLGVGLTSAAGVTKVHLGEDGEYVYVASAEGDLYRSSLDDLMSWELAAIVDGTVTALHHRLVAVTEDGVAKVLRTEDGTTYSQVGDDGLGNSNNSAVTRFYNIGRHVFAVTENSVDGLEIRKWKLASESWGLVTIPGFGDESNTAVTTLIKFHGRRYASTENSVTGAAVYKFKHVD